MRNLQLLVAGLAIAGLAAVGCSSSSSVAVDAGGDAQNSASSHTSASSNKSSSKNSNNSNSSENSNSSNNSSSQTSGSMSMTDGGMDAGCYFPTFVIGLITNDTTATATPSTDIGANCTDTQDAGAFNSLF